MKTLRRTVATVILLAVAGTDGVMAGYVGSVAVEQTVTDPNPLAIFSCTCGFVAWTIVALVVAFCTAEVWDY